MTAKESLTQFPAPTAPVFHIVDGGITKQIVNCKSLTLDGADRWLLVAVPIEPKLMPKGTHVMVHSVGTVDATGREEIPGTKFYKDYTVTGVEVGGQIQVHVPYVPYIKHIQPPMESGLPSGYIKIWYIFEVNGSPTKSDEFFHQVMLLSSGLYCEGTPT
ncbi:MULTISPECIES: hypothetical protein [unclassified Pseudomonas]|uniref:hypothetical protein n=1 Tax=unclassified Pseudomonas TaxID=196821 RepID=UPI000CD0AFB6|nr:MULTISPECIES: hypothetical protein [unclassified Pseudomonas]POA29431.1 hypothetical protein C1887_19095 [Pseudomonas sp. GW456-R21]POA61239.1 hypothetical protein C1884_28635 [Pseudomonas sp. GW460-R15]